MWGLTRREGLEGRDKALRVSQETSGGFSSSGADSVEWSDRRDYQIVYSNMRKSSMVPCDLGLGIGEDMVKILKQGFWAR